MTSYDRAVLIGDLEARWDRPADPSMAMVLCHPHPLYGGTMRGPLMHAVTMTLVRRGIAVLRFNFRGVGASGGAWGGGVGEIEDVATAMEEAGAEFDEVAVGGWSFGAVVALRWQERESDHSDYVGIAPPVASELTPDLPQHLEPARRLFIVGDRDQFVPTDALKEYAARVGAQVEVLAGSDHFFHFREERVGELIADFVVNAAE
jgi:alpha/beta superfamily hydrolase